MSFSNYTNRAILNSVFGKTSNFGALASAPTIYVALSTTTPTEAGGNVTEPSGNGYARVETSPSDWNAATDADPSVVDNAADIQFPLATGAWGACTHVVIYDAGSSGTVLASSALTVTKSPTAGDILKFAAGDFTFSQD